MPKLEMEQIWSFLVPQEPIGTNLAREHWPWVYCGTPNLASIG